MGSKAAARQIKPRLSTKAGDAVMQRLQGIAANDIGKDQTAFGFGKTVEPGEADLDRRHAKGAEHFV